MLNCMASLAILTSLLKVLPGKLAIKRHSPSILYHDIASESDIIPCIKITEPQVVYIFCKIASGFTQESMTFQGLLKTSPTVFKDKVNAKILI